MTTLALSEVFGPTIQGEGPAAGTPAAFVRTAACNLACVWCDTAYTWDWKRFDPDVEVHQVQPADAAADLLAHLPPSERPLVVLTGGEPMLQQPALAEMLSHVRRRLRVEVETAGTRPIGIIDPYVDRYVVSLKLAHSGNTQAKRERADVIAQYAATGRAVWKFVCQVPADVDEAAALVKAHDLPGQVFIMPEGATRERLTERSPMLVDAIIAHGYRMSPRLHIALWGNERGR